MVLPLIPTVEPVNVSPPVALPIEVAAVAPPVLIFVTPTTEVAPVIFVVPVISVASVIVTLPPPLLIIPRASNVPVNVVLPVTVVAPVIFAPPALTVKPPEVIVTASAKVEVPSVTCKPTPVALEFAISIAAVVLLLFVAFNAAPVVADAVIALPVLEFVADNADAAVPLLNTVEPAVNVPVVLKFPVTVALPPTVRSLAAPTKARFPVKLTLSVIATFPV